VKVLGLIAARGGSKGVPGKNRRPLLGKPLVAWTVEQARACPEISRVAISTDDPAIAAIGREYGAEVPFVRPPELANDQAGKWHVWQHALKAWEEATGWSPDLFVDLDCTSPLRDVEDISKAIAVFLSSQCDAVMSVCPARKNPYFNMVEYQHGALKLSKTPPEPILRRQDAPAVYEHVASIYVVAPRYLREANSLLAGKAIGYDLGPEKGIDIDTEVDFEIVEYLMKRRLGQRP